MKGRRCILRAACALFAALLTMPLLGCSPKLSERQLFAMDTYVSLRAYGKGADKALGEIEALLTRLDSELAAGNEMSEIYAVNDSKGSPVKVSPETLSVLTETLGAAADLGGYFALTSYAASLAWGFGAEANRIPENEELVKLLPLIDDSRIVIDTDEGTVTLPEGFSIGLGACAKGYAANAARGILAENGVGSALIDLGSSTVLAVGRKPDGSRWRIALRDPLDASGYAGVIEAEDAAVSTSGIYERFFTGPDGKKYGHIIDPATASPAENGLLSVSVISKDALYGDILSTALFVMGSEKAGEYWRSKRDFDFIMLFGDGSILATEGALALFAPSGRFADAKTEELRED